TYLYIAHFTSGVEETYLGDIAVVLQEAGCYRLPDSLFALHIENNPRDHRAIGNHAILLAQNWRFREARRLIDGNIRRFRGERRNELHRDLGFVRTAEYLRNDSERALAEAFEAFRNSKFGSGKSRTTMQRGIADFRYNAVEHPEPGKYSFNLSVAHAMGSDAIVVEIKGRMVFGREMTSTLPALGIAEIEKIFGDIYLAPGERLVSEDGALEIIGDLGDFAPFYDGRVELQVELVFPDGSRRMFQTTPEPLLSHSPGLAHITSELHYGKGDWADSMMTLMADTGLSLPAMWRESAYLSTALEDSLQWADAVNFVDSLINLRIHPNLWVYRGALDYLLGNLVEARHPLNQALQSDPYNYWAMHNLALVEYGLGNYEQSIELFIKTAEINPEMSMNYILVGVLYEELGDLERALEYYRMGHRVSAFRGDEVISWMKTIEEQLGIESEF
ncbi:MAG TPA: tetratricopeptide repeat protein, partial [candidate division Zixibacteria bacterium]|nr:tetratricopeptide repeat protein [candidate division Zixibacteria bacterium]